MSLGSIERVMKTKAARLLDTHGAAYTIRTYVVDEAKLYANYVASKIGLPAAQVFKTVFLSTDDGRFAYGVLRGNAEIDLKTLAQLAGAKRMTPVPVARLYEFTSYVRGAVTVVGAKGRHRVYVDETIREFDLISISGGKRGVQILLEPEVFLRVTGAKITKDNSA